MTLPSSGSISFSQIAAELGTSLPLTIPSAETRTLSGVASGPITIPDDFYGKSWASAASFIGTADAENPGSGHTFSGVSIGAAQADRRVVVGVHWETSGATELTLDSASIGGIAATIHRQSSHSGGSTGLGSAIISAAVPSGTTGDIVVSFSGSLVIAVSIGVTRLIGLASGTPHATQSLRGAGVTTVSGSISVPANGVLVMVGTGSTNTTSAPITFTGGTERYDAAMTSFGRRGGTVDSGLSAETRTIGMSLTATNSGVELVAASWA